MTNKAGGRSALIIATGLFVCFAGSLPAAAAADDNAADYSAPAGSKSASTETESAAGEPLAVRRYIRHGSRHWKRHAHHKSSKVAQKSSPARKTETTDVAADDDGISTALPPWAANANAQMATADAPDSLLSERARAMFARASENLHAAPAQPPEAQPPTETAVVPTDQPNEVDRTLPESASPAPALAPAHPPAATEAASSDEGSSGDEASLIGKIFIGLGSLLTLASAARMLMV